MCKFSRNPKSTLSNGILNTSMLGKLCCFCYVADVISVASPTSTSGVLKFRQHHKEIESCTDNSLTGIERI